MLWKENLSNYYKFNSKEFYDIFTYLIVFLMFGPGYMTMISKINLFMFNNFNLHIFFGDFLMLKALYSKNVFQ